MKMNEDKAKPKPKPKPKPKKMQNNIETGDKINPIKIR